MLFGLAPHRWPPPIFLLRFPGAVARDEDRVAIFGREHVAGIEPHAKRGCMRAQQCDRLGELVARVAPPEFLIGNLALVAVRIAEIVLAGLGKRPKRR